MKALAPAIGDLAIEQAISKVAERFRFVLDVTPIDVESQRRAFLDGDVTTPTFTYRPLENAPEVLSAELSAIDVTDVSDADLRSLISAKHRELRLQIAMLRARGSRDFVRLSEELYGPIDGALVREAETILAGVRLPDRRPEEHVGAAGFAALADRELAHYLTIEPDLGVHVRVRPDVAGVMVSGSVLFVSSTTCVRRSRVDALLHHEVGTHLLTYANGRFQPIGMMASGLAGYEETQEGLALLAEFLVGGLSPFRLRQLAARVVAVRGMMSGKPFATVHQDIVDHGFSRHSAFTTTMRVFRSGGFTKDAIYLRGLLTVLNHVRAGGELDALWMGKFPLSQLDTIRKLASRGMLKAPRVRPRFLDFPATADRLDQVVSLTGFTDLTGDLP